MFLYCEIYEASGRPTGRTSTNPGHGFQHFCAYEAESLDEIVYEDDDNFIHFKDEISPVPLYKGIKRQEGWVVLVNGQPIYIADDGEFVQPIKNKQSEFDTPNTVGIAISAEVVSAMVVIEEIMWDNPRHISTTNKSYGDTLIQWVVATPIGKLVAMSGHSRYWWVPTGMEMGISVFDRKLERYRTYKNPNGYNVTLNSKNWVMEHVTIPVERNRPDVGEPGTKHDWGTIV
jgi:hypothetical protein